MDLGRKFYVFSLRCVLLTIFNWCLQFLLFFFFSIMGLYASVVLVIGKFVREFFSGISHSIMFEELPNVDRILKLCTDIFLVRETGELELEEDLYAKLIFLYRSPETMIKWTREKTNWYLRTQSENQDNIWIFKIKPKKAQYSHKSYAFLIRWKWFLFWQAAKGSWLPFIVKATLQVQALLKKLFVIPFLRIRATWFMF